MTGNKLITVGICVMNPQIKAKEKVSHVSQGQENINPFSMALNNTEKTGHVLYKTYAQTSIIILAKQTEAGRLQDI